MPLNPDPSINYVGQEFVFTRTFQAPRARVFEAWTDPTQMAQWWGPKTYTNPVCQLDVKPGGAIHIVMRSRAGDEHPMGGHFVEIDEPRKLVFVTNAFAGADGKPCIEILNTVLFEERNGATELTLTAKVLRATPEVAGPISGMQQGWTQSLEKLTDLVATY